MPLVVSGIHKIVTTTNISEMCMSKTVNRFEEWIKEKSENVREILREGT
jgi:mevalonate pyrophosphate decarboxylase